MPPSPLPSPPLPTCTAPAHAQCAHELGWLGEGTDWHPHLKGQCHTCLFPTRAMGPGHPSPQYRYFPLDPLPHSLAASSCPSPPISAYPSPSFPDPIAGRVCPLGTGVSTWGRAVPAGEERGILRQAGQGWWEASTVTPMKHMFSALPSPGPVDQEGPRKHRA